MTSVLLLGVSAPDAPDLARDLESVGIHVIGAVSCGNLVQAVVRQAPDLVVGWESSPDEVLFEALALLEATDPRPVVLFTADPDAGKMERALACGVQVYAVQGYGLPRLRPLLHLATLRFRRERALREELTSLSARFEERKLVDRAKGILMRATQMSEEEAFRILRTASMHGKQRVGQVSRQIIDGARGAEAVNRAGQLRMLSQRLVKLYALRAANVEVVGAGAATLLTRSVARADENIDTLGRLLSRPTYGDLLDAVQSAWQPLKAGLLAPSAEAGRLCELDGFAEGFLSQAECLTTALEAGAQAAPLHVINISGRQRMLSQRLAKLALMEGLGQSTPEAQERLRQTVGAFEQALEFLAQAPLSTPDIRIELDTAQRTWLRMREGVQQAATTEGRLLLAETSEALLDLSEQLTDRYERSMNLLIG